MKNKKNTLENLDRYRSEFPITKEYTVMNNAAVSPVSNRVVETVESVFWEFSHCAVACYTGWIKRAAEVRRLVAGLIHSDANEIAFVGNTSEGLSGVAAGLKWKKGDGVLIPTHEFPANVYAWMNLERQGVRVDFIQKKEGRFSNKDIEKALSPGTRLISISSVDFVTGFRCDLEALGDFCKRKGLLFCVDAIQSLGVIPMDVKEYGIHFMAAGSHKWLLSTMGTGVLFISKDVNDLIHPERVGWKSVIQEEDFFPLQFDLKPDALRFEPGTMNVAGIYALGAAVELLLEVGIENAFERVLGLNDLIFEGLKNRNAVIVTPMGKGERSGIISFIPASDPKTLYRFLTERKIMVSLRDHLIRLSPHFYNNRDDVNCFFHALDDFES
jgi:cysteine desulfurase/selenocysteine lyase